MVIRRENETNDDLINRWKREVARDGIIAEMKKREYYLSPSQKRKEKAKRNEERKTKKHGRR